MNTVDLDDISTWPHSLTALLDNEVNHIITSEQESIKWEQSEEKYLIPDTAAEYRASVRDKIIEILNKEYLRIFHATRIYDIEAVKQDGLRLLNKETQKQYVLSVIESQYGVPVATTFKQALLEAWNPQGEREGQICFYIPRQLGGTEDLLKYFGGEYIRFSLGRQSPLLPYLADIGEPKIITVRYPFNKIRQWMIGNIAGCFVQAYKKLSGHEYSHYGADIFIYEAIRPSLIENISNPSP